MCGFWFKQRGLGLGLVEDKSIQSQTHDDSSGNPLESFLHKVPCRITQLQDKNNFRSGAVQTYDCG